MHRQTGLLKQRGFLLRMPQNRLVSAEVLFPFRDNVKGKTITFVLSMDDEPGLLSLVLKKVAEFHANILTIHQTIPVNGVASLTLSVDILPSTGDSSKMIEEIEQLPGVRYLKILSRE